MKSLALTLLLFIYPLPNIAVITNPCEQSLVNAKFYDMYNKVTPTEFLLDFAFSTNPNQQYEQISPRLFSTNYYHPSTYLSFLRNLGLIIHGLTSGNTNPKLYLHPFKIHPEKLHSLTLSNFGNSIQSYFNRRLVVDLASGNPNYSPTIRLLSEFWGAKEYLGIDRSLYRKRIEITNEFEIQKGFKSTYIRSDILDFLGSFSNDSKKIFVVEGLETYGEDFASNTSGRDYMEKLLDSISSVCNPGDILLVGGVVSHIMRPGLYSPLGSVNPELSSFELVYSFVSKDVATQINNHILRYSYYIWKKK